MSAEIQSVRIFIAYAHEDDTSREKLRRQLSVLERRGHFQIFWDGLIMPGERWDERLKAELHRADIFLLLVSEYFLDSDYVHEVELPKALALRNEGKAEVLPVILRSCLWQYTELTDFQCILCEGKPVEDVNGYAHVATIVAETAKQINDRRADEMRKQQENAAREQAEKTAAEQAKREAAERVRAEKAEARRKTDAGQIAREQQLRDEADHDLWEFAEEADSEAAYRRYLSKYSEGLHAATAKTKLETFEKKRAEALAAEAQRAKEAEKKKREEEARKKREQEEAERKKREQAQRDADRSLQDDKKGDDPFADLMLPIKGGAFDMGSNEYDDEKPIHRVTVKDFHLCKYPVTQAQWKQIMGENPSHFKGDDLPVEKVSWDDAQAFIKKLNEKTGKKYRLPSEAEWEYAARGGVQSKGYKYAGSNDLKEVGWFSENSGSKTHPVGQKKANELGLHDMSGNVWEWCQDVWRDNYKGAPDDGSAWEKGGSSSRVCRGGSWSANPVSDRVASRDWFGPNYRSRYLGFRAARD